MIIKGLLRRYKRWNPVHPTYGAFWGVGIGLGCGVGWGPGFGPEVVGYVGSGCGAGFSIGFTLLGLGIGLPANYLFAVPHNAFVITRRGISEIAQSQGVVDMRNAAHCGLHGAGSHISRWHQKLCTTVLNFRNENSPGTAIDLQDMKRTLFYHTRSINHYLQKASRGFLHPDKGSKD